MRWCLVLVVVLALLVTGVVKVATRGRGSLAPAARVDVPAGAPADETVDAPRPSRLRPPPRRAPARAKLPAVDPGAGGPRIATLHGRVHFAQGDRPIALGDIEVVASDRARSVAASTGADGRFTFHLPTGSYQLTASFDSYVGVRRDVLARAGVDREVDLELREGASITGRARRTTTTTATATATPTDTSVSLTAVASDEPSGHEVGGASIGDDTFSVDGLVPGRRYDLTFAGPRIRPVKLRGVAAPAENLEVILTPLSVVRGMVGFTRGETCPIDEVRLVAPAAATRAASDGPGGEGTDTAEGRATAVTPDGACAFELVVPDGVTQATVVATGIGWRLEEPVEIPLSGDPPPLCLNPPCAPASEVAANVRVEIEGAPEASGITAQLLTTHEMCISTSRSCEFERKAIGAALAVVATNDQCLTDVQRILVARGENVVRLLCKPRAASRNVVEVADGVVDLAEEAGRIE